MRVNSSAFRVSIHWNRPFTVSEGIGACITARRGAVWITQDHDLRDVVLTSGESFVLDQPGPAIVQAMDKAEILVRPAKPAPPRASGWLSQRMLGLMKGLMPARGAAR
jgi:hypothetical protein